jgi:hypothetical protein
MKYYRCYFLTADDHIASAQVLKCAGDDDAKRQCRELAFTNDRYAGAEIWDGARRLYRYPEAADALARESRRKDDATAEPGLELCLVVPPCQSVHAGCSVSLEREERQPEQVDADMVEERGEPFLLPLLSDLPYAAQRLGHAFPVLCPARAVLTRIPLGPRPSLHRLRSRLPGLVRRLRRYYGGV